ncbi:MAG: HEAT repeat domain-containing protein [Phycisphaerae bacterium]|nr:HEAT repeat domain-containing protein [Phycisphaerae bacterium]
MPNTMLQRFAWGLLAIGGLSMAYCLYDLISPGHFVGDMYGMEVMFRLLMLSLPVAALLVGGVLFHVGRRKRSDAVCWTAAVLLVLPTLALVVMAGFVLADRRDDAVRRQYPSISTHELLRIAREQNEMFAIEELLVRQDPAVVPGLCEILRDANEDVRLRCGAAHALGEIGGPEARAALEQIRVDCPDKSLRFAIDYALERRIAETRPAE